MHELGIVFYIIRDVKKVAEENHVDKVSAVVMDIGEVSTVVPDYLQDCWKWAVKKETVLKDCKIKIEIIPAVTFCEDCKQEYPTVQHGKTCPYCGSLNTYLVQGNEFMIKEIEVVDKAPDSVET